MDQYETKASEWMRKQHRVKGGLNVDMVADDLARNREKTGKEKLISEDGKIRSEIHNFIREKLAQGYSPDGLYKRLNFVFGASKYAPYKKYFKTWIMNAVGKQIKSEEKDGEER